MTKRPRFCGEFRETLGFSLYAVLVLFCAGFAMLAVGSIGPSLFVCAAQWWNENPRIDGYQRVHGHVVFSDGSTLPWFIELAVVVIVFSLIWIGWTMATALLNCLLLQFAKRTALRWRRQAKLAFPRSTRVMLNLIRMLAEKWNRNQLVKNIRGNR
jgi:hypothetical protein